jgi:hypothetical protein
MTIIAIHLNKKKPRPQIRECAKKKISLCNLEKILSVIDMIFLIELRAS